MNRLSTMGLAAIFAGTSTFAMLLGNVQQPAASHQGLLANSPAIALADKDDHAKKTKLAPKPKPAPKAKVDKDDQAHNCTNPAQNMRGWCKHAADPRYYLECKRYADGDFDKDDHCKYKKIKTSPAHAEMHGRGSLSGTVISVSGSVAQVRLDDGRIVTVNENGTALTVGQHYNLNGCYQNNVFVLGCYTNGSYPAGSNLQISGTILSVNGNLLTLAGLPPVTIDVSQAVSSGRTNGPLTPLRHITAYGYHQNNTFYATTIR